MGPIRCRRGLAYRLELLEHRQIHNSPNLSGFPLYKVSGRLASTAVLISYAEASVGGTTIEDFVNPAVSDRELVHSYSVASAAL